MSLSSGSSLSSLLVCVDFLGNAKKPLTEEDKDATLVMLEASHRIVQDLCNSNEFQAERLQVVHLGRRYSEAELDVKGSNTLRHNSGEDGVNFVCAFQQQRWAFFSIRPSRTSVNTTVSVEQATCVCVKVLELVQGYVANPSFVRGITFGVSTNASLAKHCCARRNIGSGNNIKFACTSEEIENLIHQFHPCDGIIPELANNERLRMKIDANNVANVHELLKERNLGFFTGKLGLSKILATKVMDRLDAFSSLLTSRNDENTSGKNKSCVSAKKTTHVSVLSVYKPLQKCENNSDANFNDSFKSIVRDLSRATFFHGIFFNRWPEDLICEVHIAPTDDGDSNNKGVFEEKVNFPSFFSLIGNDGWSNRKQTREALVKESCSILDSKRRGEKGNSSSWFTIVDVMGDKLANLIRQVIGDDPLLNARALRVQASSFVPERGGDCRIMHPNKHEMKGRGEHSEGERSDGDDRGNDADAVDGDPGEYQSNKEFYKHYYEALDHEYEGAKHYGGRFEHELKRKGPNASANERSKPKTTRLQTEQKKWTNPEINRDVKKNARTIQPLVGEIYASTRTVTGKSRRNAFEPDEDAVKRLLGEKGEATNVCALLDFISYGDSNPKVIRDVLSAAEDSQQVGEDHGKDEKRDFDGERRTEFKKRNAEARGSVWRDAT